MTSTLTDLIGQATYVALALVALWGAFCAIVVWRRIAQARFRTPPAQTEFLTDMETSVVLGDYDGIVARCEGDRRVVPQLVRLAVLNRELGYQKLRTLVAERFERDVLADLEYRLSWISAMIKTAPMLGLYGTVLGMMGAFEELAAGQRIDTNNLARNISLALVTTAVGLTIAIPLIISQAAINVRIRRLEDMVGQGLAQFFETLKTALPSAPGQGGR